MDSRKFSEYFLLLEKIKLVVFDCDGVMTDGGIYINNKEESFRKFDVKDGVGVKLLQSKNIFLACISGSNSPIINIRSESLGITIVKTGIKNKAEELKKIQQKLNLLDLKKAEKDFLEKYPIVFYFQKDLIHMFLLQQIMITRSDSVVSLIVDSLKKLNQFFQNHY